MDGRPLGHVSGFEDLGFVFDESGTDCSECCREGENGRKAGSGKRSLANTTSLRLSV